MGSKSWRSKDEAAHYLRAIRISENNKTLCIISTVHSSKPVPREKEFIRRFTNNLALGYGEQPKRYHLNINVTEMKFSTILQNLGLENQNLNAMDVLLFKR